jgi:hypothetical protein
MLAVREGEGHVDVEGARRYSHCAIAKEADMTAPKKLRERYRWEVVGPNPL